VERRVVELHGGLRRRGATAAEMCFGEEGQEARRQWDAV
jgi:hypothetical protein